MRKKREDYVFGLDIGTRSIVGTLGYRVGTDRFVVVAQVSIEHKTRAVIDGQIHDIPTVTKTIAEVKARLESMTGATLSDVSIAAAGRVLKTKNIYVEYEMPSESRVTKEHIFSLDNIAVEKAYDEVRNEGDHKDKRFYCVGYSPVKYYLNGYPMEMIEQHMASSIGVEMITTFLPDEVVEGLYSAVEDAGLRVASLTLEPIAAINLAIPDRFRLLNIALVDVGAGTSDISIVKDGSIIAFGMIPLAGDEITEAIAKKYLVDFETAEEIKKTTAKGKSSSFKNVMGESYRLKSDEVMEVVDEAIETIVDQVAGKVMELNGGKSVSAVFVVGGGGKMPGFTAKMAEKLELPENRVAIRGAEVLQQIDFSATGIKKDSTLVTPIGICMEYYEQKSNFIYVRVNEERVKIYDNGKATVLDACIHAGFSQESLFPSRGKSLFYTVNGRKREVKGRTGEAAEVRLNGKETNLNELIKDEDEIYIRPATKGEDALLTIGKVPEFKKELSFTLFGRRVTCPKRAEVNGELRSAEYELHDGDEVTVHDFYSVAQLLEFMGMEQEERVLVDGEEVDVRTKLKEGAKVERIPEKKPEVKPVVENVLSDLSDLTQPSGQDPLLAPVRPLPAWASDLPISNPAVRPYQAAPQATASYAAPVMPAPSPIPPVSGFSTPTASQASMIPSVSSTPPVSSTPSASGSLSGFSGSSSGRERSIEVKVNGKKVKLLSKANHMFVDVFDVYPFDLTKAGGNRMVCRVNGMEVRDFTKPVFENDEIDLYWEK